MPPGVSPALTESLRQIGAALKAPLVSALDLAEHGVPVFPCWPPDGAGCSCVRGASCDRPAKHPAGFMVPRGLKDATTDPETLTRWWSRPERKTRRPWNPAAALPPGLVVVDLDAPEAAEALHAEGFTLPATLTAETGRPGGLHCWYTCDPPLPSGDGPVPRVDIKGTGGYVMVPPSLHVSGRRYAWRRAGFDFDLIAPAPEWLYELARPASAPSAPTDPDIWAGILNGPVFEGVTAPPGALAGRNTIAARVAGLLFRRLPALAAWPLLCSWNATACRPPLDADALASIAASIAGREFARRGGQ